MPSKPLKPCCQPGCPELISGGGRCEKHKKENQRYWDKQRGTAAERGYTHEFSKRSKAFLARPENQFCVLRFPGCNEFSQCTDHIKPVGPDDLLFMDESNWQPACIHCNSVKGRRELIGNG